MNSVLSGSIFDAGNTFGDVLAKRRTGLTREGIERGDEKTKKLFDLADRLAGFKEFSDPVIGICCHCGDDCHTVGFEFDIIHPSCYAEFMPSSLKELVLYGANNGCDRSRVVAIMKEENGEMPSDGIRTLGDIHRVAVKIKPYMIPSLKATVPEIREDVDEPFEF